MEVLTLILKDYLLPAFYSFVACAGFCFVCNIRGKQLFFAALGGGVAWLAYLVTGLFLANEAIRYFLAAVVFSAYAEIMARIYRAPVTCYLLIALIPLVPGGGIYYTMEHCVNGDTQAFLETGLHTLGLAGALALGVVVVSTLFRLKLLTRLRRALKPKTSAPPMEE